MRVRHIPVAVVAVALGMYALTSQADNGNTEHVWMPRQPSNTYWDAPNWPVFSKPPSNKPAQPQYKPPTPPAYNDRYQRPARPAYRPPYPVRNSRPAYRPSYPARNSRSFNTNRPDVNRGVPPTRSVSRNNQMPPPPGGPYRGATNIAPYGRDNGASAFNTPGYNPNRNYRRKTNKFWGRSGPGTWMNPDKGNMERGWDDMINAPGRAGKIPGGWTAPEVTVPNPVDVGDQMQDNVEDLPDQVRDMDVGN